MSVELYVDYGPRFKTIYGIPLETALPWMASDTRGLLELPEAGLKCLRLLWAVDSRLEYIFYTNQQSSLSVEFP